MKTNLKLLPNLVLSLFACACSDNTGVALNGVLLGPPAALDMILESHTLGVFDKCGGETDKIRGYHYHASAPGNNQISGCFMGERGSFEK